MIFLDPEHPEVDLNVLKYWVKSYPTDIGVSERWYYGWKRETMNAA